MTTPSPARSGETPEGRTILVVEDEASVRSVVAATLRRHGFRVLEAAGERAALEHLDQSRVDLVLCDVMMPDMNGKELHQRVSRTHAGLPFVLMTGYGDEDCANLTESGGVSLLAKPFGANELLATIADMLASDDAR